MTSRYLLLTAAGFGLLIAGTQALAAPATQEPAANENIVEIGPDQSVPADPPARGRTRGSNIPPQYLPPDWRQGGSTNTPPTPASPYWIGLLAGEVSPELRAHLTLPEGKGLLVREVVPNSPAQKAGVQQYDVIVAADDRELADMRELVQLVSTAGDDGADIALQIVRGGQQEVLTITPEKRPDNVAGRGGPGGEFGPPGGPEGFGPPEGFDPQNPGGMAEEMMRRFPGFGRMRGGLPGGGGGMVQMQALPNGVSISIQKQNDQPAKITVQRGNEKWEVQGDDPASLEQLPEELRAPVSQMLAGLNGPQMPQFNPWNLPPEMAPNDDAAINQRMQQMEQQLQELKRKFLDEQGEEE